MIRYSFLKAHFWIRLEIDQQGEICLTLENFIRNCLLQSVDNSNVYFQEPTGHQDHESVVGTTEFPSNDEEDVVQLQGSLVSFVWRVNIFHFTVVYQEFTFFCKERKVEYHLVQSLFEI